VKKERSKVCFSSFVKFKLSFFTVVWIGKVTFYFSQKKEVFVAEKSFNEVRDMAILLLKEMVDNPLYGVSRKIQDVASRIFVLIREIDDKSTNLFLVNVDIIIIGGIVRKALSGQEKKTDSLICILDSVSEMKQRIFAK
jgi:hypothetical protein